jgi:4-diphosphocytidyl-2-C-methyl-D-erythritol kinase
MTSRAIEVAAPGKVNLILRVLDRRPDNYHNLWSLMQTVELADTIVVETDPTLSGIQLSCDRGDLPIGPGNLAYRAAEEVLKRVKTPSPLRIHIRKRLPVAAGLGGGSSDAAATIRALAVLFETGWSAPDMAVIGQEVGSDVPFFFHGPTAVVEGRGERVTPVSIPGQVWLILMNPGIPISTAWAYGRLAEERLLAGLMKPDPERTLSGRSVLEWPEVLSAVSNDFSLVMEQAYPLLRDLRLRLLRQGAQAAVLSGSGSTVFGVYLSRNAAEEALTTLPRETGCGVWLTSTRTRHDPVVLLN